MGLDWFKTPQSVSVLGADILLATGANTLSQAIKLDASLADSYNTTGYIENMSIRGFLLDPSSNYRRNGLAISNYAPLALENKERIEILKGVAGMQSGVSSPGGLVNFVTKGPVPDSFNTVQFTTNSNGGAKAHMDSNGLWGPVTFPISDLLNAIIAFLAVAVVVYFVFVYPMNRVKERAAAKAGVTAADEEPKLPTEQELLVQIRDLLSAQPRA